MEQKRRESKLVYFKQKLRQCFITLSSKCTTLDLDMSETETIHLKMNMYTKGKGWYYQEIARYNMKLMLLQRALIKKLES